MFIVTSHVAEISTKHDVTQTVRRVREAIHSNIFRYHRRYTSPSISGMRQAYHIRTTTNPSESHTPARIDAIRFNKQGEQADVPIQSPINPSIRANNPVYQSGPVHRFSASLSSGASPYPASAA
jgi:hypothetical protein